MKKIDHPTATPDGEFSPGDPDSGQLPTVVTADWLTILQSEITNTIESQGIQLDGGNSDQLREAIEAIAAGTGGTGSAGFGNQLLNGTFNVWQRGTTFEIVGGDAAYTADRWVARRTDGSSQPTTIERVPFEFDANDAGSQIPLVGFARYAMRVAGNYTGSVTLEQRVEEPLKFVGQAVTFSLFAKREGFPGTYNVTAALTLVYNDGVNPDLPLGAAVMTFGGAGTDGFPGLTASEWQREQATITVPSFTAVDAQQVPPQAYIACSFTWTAANNPIEMTALQTEFSTTATQYQQLPPALDLAACRRYFETSLPNGVGADNFEAFESSSGDWGGLAAPGTVIATHGAEVYREVNGGSTLVRNVRFSTPKRVIPDLVLYATPPTNGLPGQANRLEINGSDVPAVGVLDATAAGFAGVIVNGPDAAAPGDLVSYRWVADAEL